MDGERVAYRPTSHYAYHPSDNAVLSVHEFAGNNWHLQDRKRIMLNEITAGIDELGVLLAGHAKNAYWYGSQLSIEEARKLAPYNSATSLQVTSAALSGMIWAMENPEPRHRRARRHGIRASARDLHAVPGQRWSASTRIGRRCISAASCLPRIWTPRIRGNSRTFGWFESVADGDHREGGRPSRQRDADFIAQALAEQAASQAASPC